MKKTGENSSYDWSLILLCFAVLLVIVIAIDAFFYNELSMRRGSEIIQNQPSQILNRIDFDETVRVLNEKKSNPLPVPEKVIIDPSL